MNKLHKSTIADSEKRKEVINRLNEVSPDFSNYLQDLVEFHQSRPALNGCEREIAILASLITQGVQQQIELHMHKALDLGMSEDQIKEIIIQISLYSGMPKAVNAFLTFETVLNEREKNV